MGEDGRVRLLGKPSHAREVIRVGMRVEGIDQTGSHARVQRLDKSVDLVQTGIDRHRRTAGGVHHEVAEATTIRARKVSTRTVASMMSIVAMSRFLR